MSLQAEEWVPVKGFPGYSVNPLGQVRKDSHGRPLQIRFNQQGVPYVGMVKETAYYMRKQFVRSLPKLVASAFLPSDNEIFDTPINLDGDRTNCHADNLMWRPRWYAVQYANQFKERYENAIDVPVREIETGEVFPNSLAAACRFGVLEREVVLSILNNTVAWPTYQYFEIVE